MKVEFYKHNIGQQEIAAITKTLKSLFLTTGEVTSEFEQQFAKYLSCQQVIGVTSCTAALHLSLFTLGIGNGDEVITTPLSFYATANAILYTGAKPVFVDVETDTGLIDPRLIEKAINKKTKAILPVHLYGQMCDMKRIHGLAKKYNLKIVEDAALCIEGKRDNFKPAQLSDAACFSFHAIKSITSGEGGAIATNNQTLAEKLKFTRLHGMGKTVIERHQNKDKKQDMLMLGFKCNMFDIQAALLLNQLKNINKLLRLRTSHYDKYTKAFSKNLKINLPVIKPSSQSAKTLFTLWVDPKKRDEYVLGLQEMGIGVTIKYSPIHLSTYYKKIFGYKKGDFPIAEKISRSTITLPLYPKLKNSEMEYIVKCVNCIIK